MQNEEISADSISKDFSKTLDIPAVSLPSHNSSPQLPSELPAKLFSVPLIWVRRGHVIPPLQLLYDGPYVVLRHGPHSFTIRVGSWDEVVAISCLKAFTAQTLSLAGRRVRAQAVLPQLSGSRFQTRWFLHLPLQRRHETVPEPFSYPARWFLHAGTGGTITSSTDTVPVPSKGTATEVGPLTSSPEARALWRPAYTPGGWSHQLGVLQYPVLLVRNSARIKYKLMGFMVYF